ncbi:MAG TPA: hypothetical protein VGQ76_18940 [Thermoanaerobaculia bacterium]|jgi:hypothetical protein|nr:hypothetical protein [Thermoanaerobaculia bacterium]
MKRDVMVQNGKAIVRPRPQDAVARIRRLKLRDKVTTGTLTTAERDLVLLALFQVHGLLEEG